mmetsp:Transcript_10308/g.15451  ORF Transcript_10308/g.15451 Transcript_10308/m.15451 type:complete len:181 (+) Transcript_10308:119-661(+)
MITSFDEIEEMDTNFRKRRFPSPRTSPPPDNDFENSNNSFKRQRTANFDRNEADNSENSSSNDANDPPQYTERVFNQQKHQLHLELAERIRQLEANLRQSFESSIKELERTLEENRILKRAVTIQTSRHNELEHQLNSFSAAAMAAADYARRMEEMNSALNFRVQQIEGTFSGNRGGEGH